MLDKNLEKCIALCYDCSDICEKTLFNHCAEKGGKHLEQTHMRLMADCVDLCRTAGRAMTRGSDMHAAICAVCADICDACATSCAAFKTKEMQACADACKACAQSCREMGGDTKSHGSELRARRAG